MVSPMKKVSEIVSSSIGDTLTNIKTWANVMYNVLEHGLVGDGVTDDTVALQTLINTAIAAGRKLIFFPHGQYYVTSLTNANQVVFIGDNASFVGGYTGAISEFSVNPAVTDLDMGSHKITNLASPSAASDAATKGYADTKVSKAGDAMTGPLATPSVLVPYTPSSETDSIANYPNGITYSEAVNWFGNVIGTLITVKSSLNRNFQILHEIANVANPRMLTRSWHASSNAWSPWALAWNNLNNIASLGPNGYQKLASGLMIQWGVVQVPSGSTVTYPLAFANIPLFIGVTVINSAAHYAAVNNRSATGFTVLHDLGTTATNVTWIAVGSKGS